MIELFLKVIDRLIDLARIDEKRMKARFDEIYKPSFLELQAVHGDYLKLISEFVELLNKIPNGAKPANVEVTEAANFLRQKRLDLLPVRRKLVTLANISDELAHKNLPSEETKLLLNIRYYFCDDILLDGTCTYTSAILNRFEQAYKTKAIEGNSTDEAEITRALGELRQNCNYFLSHTKERWEYVCMGYQRLQLYVIQQTS